LTWRAWACAGLAFAALLAPLPGRACGYCIEDRVAAVYDHGVIAKARERRHRMAFFSLEGRVPAGDEARRAIARSLSSASGVDAGSVRVSVESASLSLSFDPALSSGARIRESLNRDLAARGLKVAPLEAPSFDLR
jgi:hypothetical protein